MGAEEWRNSATWPPPSKATSYYLGKPNAGAGLDVTPPSEPDAFTSFTSDPANPVVNSYPTSGAHDYRDLIKRPDVLTFDSAPLATDTEITGPIQANMFLSCDCRDTDLWVRLLDVAPDGTAFNLMNPGLDVVRASYRDMSKGRQLLQPGKIYELDLDHLITSNVFKQGHRIRVQISATFFPNFSRNLQTGELENNSSRMQKANIRIYHDRTHASRLVLPVAQ
jgi:putative CocE/NonD family hydrolase